GRGGQGRRDMVGGGLGERGDVERLAAPLRDLLRAIARTLAEGEVADFIDRALQRQLRDLPVDAATGRWLARAVAGESAGVAFGTLATSLANLAQRPRTADQLHWWLVPTARALRAGGRRFVAFLPRPHVRHR